MNVDILSDGSDSDDMGESHSSTEPSEDECFEAGGVSNTFTYPVPVYNPLSVPHATKALCTEARPAKVPRVDTDNYASEGIPPKVLWVFFLFVQCVFRSPPITYFQTYYFFNFLEIFELCIYKIPLKFLTLNSKNKTAMDY